MLKWLWRQRPMLCICWRTLTFSRARSVAAILDAGPGMTELATSANMSQLSQSRCKPQACLTAASVGNPYKTTQLIGNGAALALQRRILSDDLFFDELLVYACKMAITTYVRVLLYNMALQVIECRTVSIFLLKLRRAPSQKPCVTQHISCRIIS